MHDKFFEYKENRVDPLTKLYARDVIFEYADYLMDKNIPFCFSIMDIDNFKLCNDIYGHIIGDAVLIKLSEILKDIANSYGGVVGRYGGDEFILIVPKIVEYDDVWKMEHKILNDSATVYIPSEPNLSITVSIGLARYPLDSNNMDELMALADKALYRGKMKGRNCFIIYLPEKHAKINLKECREKAYTSMYLHSRIFNLLTRSNDLSKGIRQTIDFLGAYLMIDHLCLTDDDGLYFEYFHPICKFKNFRPVKRKALLESLNKTNGIICEKMIPENKSYTEDMKNQNIVSIFYSDISVFGNEYGFIRADVCGPSNGGRIWQTGDMDLLIHTSHIIAMLLYINNKKLKDID